MPVCTPLGQGLSAQLLVGEGNGKPPHQHPSSHFPSLDDTGVSPLSVITDLPYGRALIIIIKQVYNHTIKWTGLKRSFTDTVGMCVVSNILLNIFSETVTAKT